MSCRVLCLCRVKQIQIHNNYWEYINSYIITAQSIKINSTSARVDGWVGRLRLFLLDQIRWT